LRVSTGSTLSLSPEITSVGTLICPIALVMSSRLVWRGHAVLAAGEAVRRSVAEARARAAEEHCSALQRQAMLGSYMLDMRHTLNNTLTSVLGNSELLLLEPGSLSAGARSQIETIRNMSLRMHEILQRFSSLEKELTVVDRQAEKESGAKSHAAAANL